MTEGYVFVNLMGGMGNQMFQYAAGLLQSYIMDSSLLLCKPHTNIHDTQDYRDILFKVGTKWDGDLPSHVTLYQSDSFAPWNPKDWKYPILYLYGYFQNYSVLEPVLPKFREIILDSLSEQRKAMKNKYNIQSASGFIHVRRGDYVGLSKLHHLQDEDYYRTAYNKLTSSKSLYKMFLISDDIDWCVSQDFFKEISPIYVEESDPVNVLALMCEIKDGAIIANSTFSWMGAYLGTGLKSNSVYYPTKWFEDKNPDLFPEEWIRV